MSDQKENEAKPVQVSKNPIYWIPFSVAAIFLVIIGLFRFSDSSDSIYFIYICLIAFALAALPWISSFRVNGLFEIEREIEKTKDETRERIEQTDKRFEDRMFSMRAELMASLTSIQSQMAQQSAILNSTQSQVSQQSTIQASRQSNSQIIAIGNNVKALDKNTEDDTTRQSKEIVKNENTKKNIEIELSQSDIEELKVGFAQSAAAALDDPLGLQCSKLIRQIPVSGLSMAKFDEFRLNLEVTDEQIQTLKKLKLITVTPSENEQNEKVTITKLGQIYSDYWRLNFDISSSLASLSGVLSPLLIPALAGLWTTISSKVKKDKSNA